MRLLKKAGLSPKTDGKTHDLTSTFPIVKKISLLLFIFMLVVAFLPSVVLANDDPAEKESKSSTDKGEYETKDEVIYGNMRANGQLEEMYVVNTFQVTKPGKIIDYGAYSSVRNLTNLLDIDKNGNKIQFQAEEEKEFYYQGNMPNKPLPWDISITYILDGKEIQAEELAGKSGPLELQISTSRNENVDPEFFNNYLLQIAVTLDPTKFDNIQAPEGTKANAGENKQVNFTVMPEQEEDFIISTDVSEFEMDPIEINAAPYSMSIESPDTSGVTGEMQELAHAIRDIHAGVGDLKIGVSELNKGAQGIRDGSTEYKNGINELNQSSGELVSGSSSIKEALHTMNQTVQQSTSNIDLSAIQALPAHLREIANGLEESTKATDNLKQNYHQAKGQLDKAMHAIPSDGITEAQINELKNSNADQEVIDQLINTYRAANVAKETYNQVTSAFDGVTVTLEQSSSATTEMAKNLKQMATEMEQTLKSMNQLDMMEQIQEGVATFNDEYETFHNGLVDYTNGVEELATSYQDLNTGIQELAKGTRSTSNGIGDLYAGTKELREATSNLPGQIEQETEEMMEEYDNSDYKPSSFISDKNEQVEVVQFVLQTESIEIPEQEAPEQTEEEKGIWERFLDLFR
ncbi:YhgE/Pip domain-containing protein [Virgibacillus dokdonensis]|nr:YhgE/Pip domain-containing protein [Virgibacillus dokdonensis]